MSPFCVKLETYLRMAKIEYKTARADFRKAPKGKIPYADIDGRLVGDSDLIIQEFKKIFGDPLDQELSQEQRAIGLATQRMVEEHMYFAGAWLRWSNEDSYAYVREFFKKLLPPFLGPLIMMRIRSSFLRNMRGQGMGRHSTEEIIEFGKSDLNAISILLADKRFFFGDVPTSIDATLYGFLIQSLWVPWNHPMKEYTKSLGNLEPYCQRMKSRYWS